MGTVFEISCDDGCQEDFKLLSLLRKYKLHCTFYIAPFNTGLTPNQIRRISEHHEIGGHTLSHQILTQCDLETAKTEIEYGKKVLEDIIGKPVTKFCYPRGYYNEDLKTLVAGAGFTEARTTRVLHTEKQADLFEKHTTVHAYQRKEYEGEYWVEVAKRLIDSKPEYFHLWLHSWEIEKHNCWGGLEWTLKHIRDTMDKDNKEVKNAKGLGSRASKRS